MKKILPLFLFGFAPLLLVAQWTNLSGPTGGVVRSLDFMTSGNRLLAISEFVLYSSTNDGASWQKVVATTGVTPRASSVMVDGTDIYLVDYSAFFRSSDNGATWVRVNTGPGGQFFGADRVLRLDANTFATYGYNGVYVSTDKGVNWIQISSGKVTYNAVAAPNGDLYAIDDDGIKRHLKPGTGQSWSTSGYTTFRANTPTLFSLDLAIDGSGNMYALTFDPSTRNNLNIFRSSDGGSNWVSIRGTAANELAISQTENVYSGVASFPNLVISPDNKLFCFSGLGGNRVHMTANPANPTATAVNWVVSTPFPVAPTADASVATVLFTSSTKAFVGTYGEGILLSTNMGNMLAGGITWTVRNEGIVATNLTSIEVANTTNRLVAITNFNNRGYWTSTTGGTSWNFIPLPEFYNTVTKMPNGTMLLYGYYQVRRSTDNGATFNLISPSENFASVASTPGNVLYGVIGGLVKMSTDNGATWTTIPVTGLPLNFFFDNRFAVDASGGTDLFAVLYNYQSSTNELWKITVSAGAGTASKIEPPRPFKPTQYIHSVVVANNKLYVGQSENIFWSADRGLTWNVVGFNSNTLIPLNGGIGVSTFGTFYVTQDDGLSWNSTLLPSQAGFIQDIATDASGDFYAGTTNAGAIKNTAELVVPPASLPPYINFNWQPLNGPYGGKVSKILVDNTLKTYAVSNSFMARANTAVTSWTGLTHQLLNGLQDATINPVNGELIAVDWTSSFKSTDGGTTWTTSNSEPISGRTNIVRAPNGDIVMSVEQNPLRVFVSTDNGVTFGLPKITFAVGDRFNNYMKTVLVSGTNAIIVPYLSANDPKTKIKISIDRGASWSELNLPTTLSYINHISTDQAGNIFIASGLQVFRSADNGSSWVSVKGDLGSTDIASSLFVSPTGDYLMAVNSPAGSVLKKSTNSGVNWTDLGAYVFNDQINDIKWVGTKILVATPTDVVASTDNGATFAEINQGITNLDFGDLRFATPDRMLAGSFSGIFHTSNDKGVNWTKKPISISRMIELPGGTWIGFGGSYNCNRVYRSTDQGQTWTAYFNLSNGECVYRYFTADGVNHYISTYSNLYFSTDLVTWTKLAISGLPNETNRNLRDFVVDANGLLYLTLVNFQNSKSEAYQVVFGSGLPIDQVQDPIGLLYRQGQIYLFGSEGSLASTADGSTWTRKSIPGGNRFIITAKNYYFVSQNGGILWLSRDQGQTWQSVGIPNLGNNGFIDVAVNEFDGSAYALMTRAVARKSGNMIIPDDLTPPAIVGLSPANNSTGTSIKPTLTITFDEAIVPQAGKTLRILDLASPVTPVEIMNVTSGVQKGKSIEFTLSQFLSFNKTYFVVLDAASFKDIFGNNAPGILNNTTWRFTTKAAPTLSSVNPANNAVGVALRPRLSVTFSEPMNTVATKNVSIIDPATPATPVAVYPLKLVGSEFAQIVPGNATGSQSAKIVFNAALGGGELRGAGKVYFHAGAITSSATGTTWTNVVGNWGLDNGVGLMTKVSGETDLWEITLSPTIRQYFNVAAGTTIFRIGMVFRNANGTLKATPPASISGGAVAANGDIFLEVGNASASCPVFRSGNTISIDVCAPLQNGKQYAVRFDDGAFVSADGLVLNFMNTATDWRFTTLGAPSITSLVPANNATSVSIVAPLAITFSSPMTIASNKSLFLFELPNTTTPVQIISLAGASSCIVNQSGNTTTVSICSPLKYSTEYMVKLSQGSFISPDGITLDYLLGDTDWRFTTQLPPDTQAPTITFTTSNLNPDAPGKFTVQVTDNREINLDSTFIFYRGITTPAAAKFTKLKVPVVAGSGVTSRSFEITLDKNWYDAMGLEFYFVAKDRATPPNEGRSPVKATPTSPDTFHYSYIDFAGNTKPNFSLTGGGSQATYRMVSFPHELASSNTSTIINELGPVDRAVWRLLGFNATQQQYVDAPATLVRGAAYWINSVSPVQIAIEGAKTPQNNRTNFVSITLQRGWNMVGNPYPAEISWNEVRAGTAGISEVKIFNGSTYTNGDVLSPFQGGFVNNTTTGAVTLKVRFRGITSGGRPENPLFGSDIDSDVWAVPLAVGAGGVSNQLGGIGMHPGARIEWDDFDDRNPPRLEGMPELNFTKSGQVPVARDIVPTNTRHTWHLEVTGNKNERVVLTWDNAAFRNAAAELVLFDQSAGVQVDMRSTGQYAFYGNDRNAFLIYFGRNAKAEITPDRIFFASPSPNPAAETTTLRFGLIDATQTYQCSIDLVDVLGRKQVTLVRGQYPGGLHSIDLPTSDFANGLYILRLSVEGKGKTEMITQKLIIKQ